MSSCVISRSKVMDGRALPAPIGSFTEHMKDCARYASYQRRNTWDKHMHADYIKSLIIGEQPPPIVLNNKPENDIMVSYIIDGGHRTRAILAFQEGEFPVTLEGYNYYFKKGDKELKKDDRVLSEVEKYNFKAIPIQLLTYTNLHPDQEHQIFQDSNKQKPLTKGQLVKAVDTAFIHKLSDIVKDCAHVFEESVHTSFSKQCDDTLLGNLAAFMGVEVLNKGTYELKNKTWSYFEGIAQTHDKYEHLMEKLGSLKHSIEKSSTVVKHLVERKAFSKSKMPKGLVIPIIKVFYDETNATPMQLIPALQRLEEYPRENQLKKKWEDSLSTSNMNTNLEIKKRTDILKQIVREL